MTPDETYLEFVKDLVNQSKANRQEAITWFNLIRDPEVKKQAERILDNE